MDELGEFHYPHRPGGGPERAWPALAEVCKRVAGEDGFNETGPFVEFDDVRCDALEYLNSIQPSVVGI